MKKIFTVAGALMLTGQILGSFEPLLGTMLGMVGVGIVMVLFVAVLFVAMAERGI